MFGFVRYSFIIQRRPYGPPRIIKVDGALALFLSHSLCYCFSLFSCSGSPAVSPPIASMLYALDTRMIISYRRARVNPFSKTYPDMAMPPLVFGSCFLTASFARGVRFVPALAAPQTF